MLLLSCIGSYAQNNDTSIPKVLVMEVRDVIDPRMNRYVELALDEATEIEADYVIIDMDTYGGALNDADDIRSRILDYEKPVYVFINKDAASAGALISIACDSIYMQGGSSIGAATVVTQDGTAAPDKYQSYMRSIMRSTAESQGRNPDIAEAMVDETIDLDSISQEGKVITFSTSEAIRYGFCEAEVKNIDEIMQRSGVEDFELFTYELDTADRIIQFFLNPFISGILLIIIIGGIYFELQTPGVGFPIIAAVFAAILYFVPYYLNGIAENWEIILFLVGVVLIALEVFVIPGFGIAGVSGLILTIGSLVLVMVNNDAFDFQFVAPTEILTALGTTIAGLMGGIMIMFFGGVRLTRTKIFKRVALESVQARNDGYTSNFKESKYEGKTGVTYTVLRPSGKVKIDGQLFDAYTQGGYIGKDEEITVVSDQGTSLQVKKSNE